MFLTKDQIQAHKAASWCLAWVGETHLVTGSVDETASIWNANNLSSGPVHTFTDFDLAVLDVTVSPDENAFSSSCMDGCIRHFDLVTHTLTSSVVDTPGQHWNLEYHPSNASILATSSQGGTLALYDTRTNTKTNSCETKAGFAHCINWRQDGGMVAVGSADGSITLIDTRTMTTARTISQAHSKTVRSVSFAPDSSRVCSGSDEMFLKIFESETGEATCSLTGHSSWVTGVTFHPDSKHMASCGSDRKVKLWNMPDRECIHTFDVHSNQVWAVAFSPDGGRLASVGDDGKLHVATTQFER
jgi:WD repeat-containing protein 61